MLSTFQTTEQDILETVKCLIRFQSTADNIPEQKTCIEYIAEKFGDTFLVKRYEFFGHPVLVLSTTPEKETDIIFSGHIDVVKGSPELFSPLVKENSLHGRGAYDMKGPLGAVLHAVEDAVRAGTKNTISILITADEETSGAGTRALLEKEKYSADFALIPDGGDEARVIVGQKGFTQLALTLSGKSCHASRPWKGANPVAALSELTRDIVAKYPHPASETDWKTTVTPTKMEAGSALNQVPESATLYVDVRYVAKSCVQDFIVWFEKKYGETGVVRVIEENGMFKVDEGNVFVQKLRSVVEQHNGTTVAFARECGTSDAIFFTERDIPAALYRPTGGGEHSEEEWVATDSLFRLYEITKTYLLTET